MNSKLETKKRDITKEMLLGDLVRKYPSLVEILLKDYGLHCAGCFANTFDTIEGGAKVHGMNEREVEEMLEHLNKEVTKIRISDLSLEV